MIFGLKALFSDLFDLTQADLGRPEGGDAKLLVANLILRIKKKYPRGGRHEKE